MQTVAVKGLWAPVSKSPHTAEPTHSYTANPQQESPQRPPAFNAFVFNTCELVLGNIKHISDDTIQVTHGCVVSYEIGVGPIWNTGDLPYLVYLRGFTVGKLPQRDLKLSCFTSPLSILWISLWFLVERSVHAKETPNVGNICLQGNGRSSPCHGMHSCQLVIKRKFSELHT